MIRIVADFYASIIGFFILLALAAVIGGFIAAGEYGPTRILGVSAMAAGLISLLVLGMSCVMLDIMYNIWQVAESSLPPSEKATESTSPKKVERDMQNYKGYKIVKDGRNVIISGVDVGGKKFKYPGDAAKYIDEHLPETEQSSS